MNKRIFTSLLISTFCTMQLAAAKPLENPKHISLDAIPVCYDFGCRNSSVVGISNTEWKEVSNWFSPAADTPAQEREQIRNAIGWMEVVMGRHTPIHRDIAFDLQGRDDLENLFPGQKDCIDEAINTTTFLRLFQQQGLLRHHKVVTQAYRRSLLDQHWAGQIREIESNKHYVVDSWFQDNGYLPVIQDSDSWHDISLLTAVVDNSHESNQPEAENKRGFWRRILPGRD